MLAGFNNPYKKWHYIPEPSGFNISVRTSLRMRKLLIPLLLLPGLVIGAAKSKLFDKKLPNDKKLLHALNRLTFGPRPGDVEAVRKMGLKKWVDLQLHPSQIPESHDLLAKL